MQRLESTRTMSPCSGDARSSFGSCSSSLASNADEAMSASSRMAQEIGGGEVGSVLDRTSKGEGKRLFEHRPGW